MARGGSAARRYAEAVFALAERDAGLDRWRDDLTLAADVTGNSEIGRNLSSPMVPMTEREALIQQLLGGRLSKQAFNLVRLLLHRGKLELLGPIASEYQRLLNQRRGV